MASKLTIHFMPYDEIASLNSQERIKKLLKIILGDKIILLQGRLKSDEEARLIEDTMVMIGHVKGFKGIESLFYLAQKIIPPIFPPQNET